MFRYLSVVVLSLSVVPAAWAQTAAEIPAAPAPEPATIFVTGGVAGGGHHTGGVLGGTVSGGVTSRLSLEGQAAWLDRGPGSSAVVALGSVLVRLAPDRADASPYLALGGGMYSASFDLGMQGMFGTGPLPYPDHVPVFYQARMGGMEPPLDGRWGNRRFTDPALGLGGGATLAVGSHLVLRPDVRALVVFGDGRTQTIGLFNLGVGFRF